MSTLNKDDFALLMNKIVIHQRCIYHEFKSHTGLNRSDIEILVYASNNLLFNAYQVHKHFSIMNMQQARLTIKKLTGLKVLEVFSRGKKSQPVIYCITGKGKDLIQTFNQLWFELFDISA